MRTPSAAPMGQCLRLRGTDTLALEGARVACGSAGPAVPTVRVLRISGRLGASLATAPGDYGRVHSVFDRAINILCDDGHLLVLHGPEPLAAPFAAALEVEPRALGAVRGLVVRRHGTLLTVGSAQVDWARAMPVSMAVRPGGDPGWFVSSLLTLGIPNSAPALETSWARVALDLLAAGIRARDTRLFLRGWQGLVGLGEGSTPAGDDCFVGVLAALWRFAPGRAPLADIRRAIADAARRETTLIASEFVLHALDGWFATAVLDVVHATSQDQLRPAVSRLAGLGASSGRDLLTGLRVAADVLRGLRG